MNAPQLSHTLDLPIKLALLQQPDHSILLNLASTLEKALLTPLVTILEQLQILQQHQLIAEGGQEAFLQIQQLSSEMLAFVSDLVVLSDAKLKKSTASNSPDTQTNFAETIIQQQELLGVRALIIDNNNAHGQQLYQQLLPLGLDCALTNTDMVLDILRTAEEKQQPYQIVIFSSQYLDHHTAYIIRTIKANPKLQSMLALALPEKLANFDKELAYFNGVSCVLNLAEQGQLYQDLANSWRSWSTKTNFSQAKTMQTQNRILLVEDDPIPQKVTQRQCAELGFEVDIAADGHSALKLLQQHSYDLVFMDIGLPDISGLEVTAEFRKREKNKRHTPIIGLTIFALASDEETALHAGMDEYIVKPLLQNHLKEVVDKWVLKKKSN